MFCPACGADLDAVPTSTQCPSCGGMGRAVRVDVPALAATPSLAVGVLVRQAMDELAAMPEEAAREVVGKLIQLSGRIEGKTTLSGVPTVVEVQASGEGRSSGTAVVTIENRAGTATPLTAAATLGLVSGHAVYASAGEFVVEAPAVRSALDNPAARAVLLNLASNGIYDLLKLGVSVAVGGAVAWKLAGGQPLVNIEFHYYAAAVTAGCVEPVPANPPPTADVCLPDGPSSK